MSNFNVVVQDWVKVKITADEYEVTPTGVLIFFNINGKKRVAAFAAGTWTYVMVEPDGS